MAEYRSRPAASGFQPFPDTAMEARISADSNGLIVHVNQRAESLFGYSADELIGRPVTMLMPERFREAHMRGLERYRAAGHGRLMGQVVELTALRRDGVEFPVEAAFASWSSGDGETLFFGTLRDITERKQAEEERQRLLAELQELSSARERLLEDVAHELRGPLTSLALTIDLYRDLSAEELDDLMSRAERAVAHLQELVDDMLDSRTIQAGLFQVELRPVSWKELAAKAVEAVEPQLENARQTIQCRAPERDVIVMADRPHSTRAIVNLLSNASKYSPPGSEIVLAAEPEEEHLKVCVIDKGPGIPADKQKRLFERFYRITQDRQTPGVGLGLAIVKGIAEAHGGSVGVCSELGQGSTFWLTLPLAATKRRSAGGSSPPSRSAG
ncbi:MAG TPA: PAS domain-containing sensor histidine kinase [Chloroflexota bacterium]|nr:PAS domain-containing sensor histidine kinase [Chloroflexota bacterium]